MDSLLSLRHNISTCTSLSSQGDQNTTCWNPILSCNLHVQCWLSLCKSDLSEQKLLDPLPCLQGVRPCPAHREQRGSSTRCQSSQSRFCFTHLVGFVCEGYCCYSRLPHPTSLPRQMLLYIAHSATMVLSWPICRSVLSFLSLLCHPPVRKPNHNPIGTMCLTHPCPFLPPSASSVSLFLPSHPVSSCTTKKPSDKVLTSHLLYPFLYSLFSSLVRFGLVWLVKLKKQEASGDQLAQSTIIWDYF